MHRLAMTGERAEYVVVAGHRRGAELDGLRFLIVQQFGRDDDLVAHGDERFGKAVRAEPVGRGADLPGRTRLSDDQVVRRFEPQE